MTRIDYYNHLTVQTDRTKYDWFLYHGIKKYHNCELFEAKNYFQAALDIKPTGKYARLGNARTYRELCLEYNMYCREYCDYVDFYIDKQTKTQARQQLIDDGILRKGE